MKLASDYLSLNKYIGYRLIASMKGNDEVQYKPPSAGLTYYGSKGRAIKIHGNKGKFWG